MHRFGHDPEFLGLKILAFVGKLVAAPGFQNKVQGFQEPFAPLGDVYAIARELAGIGAPADAEDGPSAGNNIQSSRFFSQSYGVM